MASYYLKGIEDEKWKRFKATCDLQGITIKESFIHHINFTIVKGISQIIKAETNHHKTPKGGKKK